MASKGVTLMAFQKGQGRPPGAGRKPGTPNKKTVLKVEEILSTAGINPIEKVLQLITELEPRDQVKYWLELQSYCEAKPKEAENVDDTPDELTLIEQLRDVSDSVLLSIVENNPDDEAS